MRIGSINFYAANRQPKTDAQLIERLDPDAAGLQEAHNRYTLIDRVLNKHRLYWSRMDTRQSREVAVALQFHRNLLLGYGGKEVSDLEPEDESRIFKSRWMTVVRFKHKKTGVKYAIVNYHGNAAVQDKKTGLLLNVKRAREWMQASILIERKVKRLQRKGFKVFVTGDWNYRRVRVLDFLSPQRIFGRCNLDFWNEGLDYIAWPKSMKLKHKIKIGTERTASDHPWLFVDVV